ncbi:MAG: LysM peptidoglycan-binding domain-containing protein [Tannerella sp.]|jgi:membrane-bound lytic murein transglycosylase D|nr:LysM peptidoglycan-binding domain-containing protein [Tannerella sp.]
MKQNISLIILLLNWFGFIVTAQDFEDNDFFSTLSSDSLFTDAGMIPEILDENINSLLDSWHAQYFSNTLDYCIDDEDVTFPHEVYWERLSKLPCIIPMEYNRLVRNCIDIYSSRRRELVRYMMGMAGLYFPVFEQILDQYGLPLELKYLPIVESALKPTALSRVGAAGLWQFMLPTAKAYSLEVNSLIDERLDVVEATHAACKYLKDMYDRFGDWHLAIAAYNCGPGGVNRAIRRSGGKTNFWQIYPNLPRETRSFVPFFIAATYIMNYHCEHNLCPMQISLSMATDTVMVHRMLHLQQVADILNLDIEHVRMLNPQYKREIIPGNITPSVLKLPIAATYDFINKEDTLYVHRMEELLAHCTPAETDESGNPLTNETIKHTVVSGENLNNIANQYGVTAQNLRSWNGLKSNTVAAGRRITIRINNGGIRYEAAPPETVIPSTPVTANTQVSLKAGDDSEMIAYKVQPGDTLYAISKKYPGVTVDKIQSANQMTGDKLRVGQVIKIPAGG